MFFFLIPLMVGFAANLASAFTTAYSRRWGDRRGSLLTILLRDILGIPVWALGFVLAFVQKSPVPLFASPAARLLGWLLIAAGGAIILVALAVLRYRAAAPSVRDALVQSGLYGLIRHPIHSGTMLEFAGLFLARPTITVAAACVLGVVWVLVQTELEERDLLRRLPDYREYRARVPRFLPRFRKPTPQNMS